MGEGEQRQRGRDEENQCCALEHSIAMKGRERGGEDSSTLCILIVQAGLDVDRVVE